LYDLLLAIVKYEQREFLEIPRPFLTSQTST